MINSVATHYMINFFQKPKIPFLGKFAQKKTKKYKFMMKVSTYCPGHNIWNKVRKSSKTGPENFDNYLCVSFDCYCKTLIYERKTGS